MHKRAEMFASQGVLAIVVLGALLPVGLTMEFFILAGADTGRAVQHGELFLAAGSSVFLGCIVLVTSRTDRAPAVGLVSFFALAAFVIPCYGAWAVLNVRTELQDSVANPSAYAWGIPVLAAALVVALTFVWYSFPAAANEDAE